MIRVIDNKRLDLTDDEFRLYEDICKSYDRPNMPGSELFKSLFETDENGIIVFLRPASNRYISMEVWMFLVAVMVHQHVGSAASCVDSMARQLDNKLKEVDTLLEKGKSLIEKLENK